MYFIVIVIVLSSIPFASINCSKNFIDSARALSCSIYLILAFLESKESAVLKQSLDFVDLLIRCIDQQPLVRFAQTRERLAQTMSQKR